MGKGFKKGDPNINRKGRLKGAFQPSDLIKRMMEEKDPATGKQRAQAVIETAFRDAIAGDDKARAWLFDRGYGKALERIESNLPMGPLVIFPENFDG